MSVSKLRCLISTAIFAATVLVAMPAFSQTNAEKAAELYKQGLDLYFGEDYGVAITKFRDGYELDPNPMFLYSLSLCFAKLGNYPEALDHAKRAAAKRAQLPPEEAVKNDARIVAFVAQINTQALADIKVAEGRGNSGVRTCLTNRECGTSEVCNMRRGVCVQELPTDQPSERPAFLDVFTPVGWAGVGAAAVGTGLLVGGGLTSLAVKRNENKLAEASVDSDRIELADKITRQKSTGRVLIIAGAGLVLVGGGLIAVDLLVLKPGQESAVAPLITPDGGGLVWIGRF